MKVYEDWMKTEPKDAEWTLDEYYIWQAIEPEYPLYTLAYQIKKYDEISLYDSSDEIERKYAGRNAFIERITKDAVEAAEAEAMVNKFIETL